MRNFLSYIASQPWAIWEPKAREILAYLEARESGESHPEFESRLTKRKEQETRSSAGSVAVIPVRGAIANRASLMDGASLGMGTSAERLRQEIRAACDDKDTKAVVFDIDSPGGSAQGTPELAAAIRERSNETPVIAQIDGLGASAAYWIASAADEIVATPSSQIGSIGVLSVHEDISRMLEEEGVTETIITSENAPNKALGNPYEPLSERGREKMQAMVNKYEDMFIRAIAESRNTTRRDVIENYGQGDVMIANDALAAGMIDRVGTMGETLERIGAGNNGSQKRTRAAARSTALARQRLELEREKAHL